MPDQPKRYIVTFDQTQSEEATMAALGIDSSSAVEGVRALMDPEAPDPEQILQFKELGAAVVPLTETDAERLRNDEHVAEVVEDFEVVAHTAPASAARRSRWIFPPPWELDTPSPPPDRFS